MLLRAKIVFDLVNYRNPEGVAAIVVNVVLKRVFNPCLLPQSGRQKGLRYIYNSSGTFACSRLHCGGTGQKFSIQPGGDL